MNSRVPIDAARAMVADDNGVLAVDESSPTCDKRLARLGFAKNWEARRAYRDPITLRPPVSAIQA
jgi:fructose-bisphosphate aldolase, class I